MVRLTSDRAARRQHFPFPPLLLQILAAEGPAGLYRGLGAVVAGVGPAAAIYFGAVETARTFASRFPPSPLADAAVGVAAQLVAGVAFTPVDVIKERLQAARLTRSPVQSPLAAARANRAEMAPPDAYGWIVFARDSVRPMGVPYLEPWPVGAGPATDRPRPTATASAAFGGANSLYLYLAATGHRNRARLTVAMMASRP